MSIQSRLSTRRATGGVAAPSNRAVTLRPIVPPRTARRLAAAALRLGAVAAAASLLATLPACTAAGTEVQPPTKPGEVRIFFPSAIAVAPDESVLFVASANSNLRYDSGTVTALDLQEVDDVITAWLDTDTPPAGCLRDPGARETLQCDLDPFVKIDAAGQHNAVARIGNFATDIGVQPLSNGLVRLFVPVRGDPSVTWIDYDASAATLHCADGGGTPLCDDAHRLSRLRNDPDLPALPLEPFNIYVDPTAGYAAVTHLSASAVSLVDAPVDGSAPVIADSIAGLFAGDSNGNSSAVGIAGRHPGADDNLIYVTSRTENRVQMMTAYRDPDQPGSLPRMLPTDYFFLTGLGSETGDSSRGIAFNGDGTRAFVVNRDPPALHILDTSDSDVGLPRNASAGAVELCRDGSAVQVSDLGAGERVYVTCYGAGQVWVIDPLRQTVVATRTVGRGPYAARIALQRKRLYISNFVEDTIAVVDVEPGSATENRVVLRIGAPRQGDQ